MPSDPLPRPPDPVDAWRRYDDDEQRLSAHVSERMLDLAGLRPGTRVLDIATGRGEPAVRAAARVAPGGAVLGTDLSAEMLEFARRRAAAAGVTNLSLRAVDGETLAGVPEHAFDVASCRWGLMYFAQPERALEAVRRCLVPGGRLVCANWVRPAEASWWTMPRTVLARHTRVAAIEATAPGPFRFDGAAAFEAALAASGYAVEHEEELYTAVMESATPEGLRDWCLTFGLARLLGEQPAAVVQAWMHDMLAEARHQREADGLYRLGGITRLILARAR